MALKKEIMAYEMPAIIGEKKSEPAETPVQQPEIAVVEKKSLMEQIREEAARRIVKQGNCKGLNAFMDRMAEVSLEVWLEFFPMICYEMRRVNHNKMKLLQEIGVKGKFTDSYGWSEKREFKFEYEYTPEFYFFMTTYVFAEFFGNENKKVYRIFMKKILRGDEPIETLVWVKKYYGSNSQKEIVTTS